MAVAFNPSAPAAPNLTKNAGADEASGPTAPDTTFARLLSNASGAPPKGVAPAAPDKRDADAEPVGELPVDAAATAAMPVPWLPLTMTLPVTTDLAVAPDAEMNVAPGALGLDGARRMRASAAVSMDAAGSTLLPGPAAPSLAALSGDAIPTAAPSRDTPSADDATAAATTATRTRMPRPEVDGAAEERAEVANALVVAVPERVRASARDGVNAAPAAVPPAIDSTTADARSLPAASAGDSGTLRAGPARPYTEAAPLASAAAVLQSAPDAVRDAATATKKNLLEAMSGSLPPLPQMQSAATPPATVVAIATPVGAPGWGADVAQKVAQVIFLRSETAEIRLNPPQLGPVDVRISFATDQPSVLITAPDPTTRSALEQALPHLRDLLAQQGITLGQASVQGERQPQQAFAPPERGPGGFAATSAHAAADIPPRAARPDWLVDLYA